MKKKIAIDIDLTRDWYTTLISTYDDKVAEWENIDISGVEPQDLWHYFKFPQFTQLLKDKDENGEEYDGFVETSMEEDKDGEYLPNQQYFNQFMVDHVLEIFAHAKEKEKNIIHYLNELQKSTPEIEITLYSKSKGKAKPATLFFLSKYSCEINDIRFFGDDIDVKLQEFDEVLSKINFKGSLKELSFKND